MEDILIHSPDDVIDCINEFNELYRCDPVHYAKYMRTNIDVVKVSVQQSSKVTENWFELFSQMGKWTLGMLPKGWNPYDFAKLLKQKHDAYGPGPIRSWGEVGVIIRIDSKLERYLHLKDHPEVSQADESIYDTLQDIVGYCVLGVLYTRSKK